MSQLNLEPDDPRVNPDLHVKVQAELQRVMAEERQRFQDAAGQPDALPMSIILQETKTRMRAARLAVIEKYNKTNAVD